MIQRRAWDRETTRELSTGIEGSTQLILWFMGKRFLSFIFSPCFRSCIYAYTDAQLEEANASKTSYGEELKKKGKAEITTEIKPAAETPFYYAEDYHQQYLHTNPGGYCSMRGTGVKCVEWTRMTLPGFCFVDFSDDLPHIVRGRSSGHGFSMSYCVTSHGAI